MNQAEQAALALWSDDVAARLQRQLSQTEGPGSLVPIDVQHVQVEAGVGSPVPVDAVVAGLWPGLCAQVAEVRQNMTGFEFNISLLANPGSLDCPPDHLGLSFRMAIPLNVVELPEGTYTVTVNGVSAPFGVPVTRAVPFDAEMGASLTPDRASGQAKGLCPDVPRPALALFLPGEGYLITDPLSGATCTTTLDGDVPGRFQFDCPGEQATLCIGDFQEVQVQALAYAVPGAVVIVDGAGQVLNSFELDADYVGYPTFGPEGQLAIYSARGTTTIVPDEGAIYLVDAPVVKPAVAELLVSGPDIFLPRAWLDTDHLVIGYHGADDNWHTVVVGLDGLMVTPASAANASFVDVLPAPGTIAVP